ncbi:hypothetical protein AAZX31_02G273600 [Glycine max]|nr:hypothetical protein GLYMA_02G290900v4 [Glycine max]KAG5053369.1 hypothetical protein JHK87_005567 [Glycine soja]KAG5081662.1 hypothetical protein JHK86_005727 [Glycine max]KAH1062677.1 hypothetical protein GYH30_005568 [Glycine max]RZC27271.1 hypothetical protein D0Y65_005416 [Glycine soja]
MKSYVALLRFFIFLFISVISYLPPSFHLFSLRFIAIHKMGNCLRRQSRIGYSTDDDEDWEDFRAAAAASGGVKKSTREVKIKITKKQLVELVGKVEVKELRMEQVLAHLMNHSLQRPWRPALQSIPEDH